MSRSGWRHRLGSAAAVIAGVAGIAVLVWLWRVPRTGIDAGPGAAVGANLLEAATAQDAAASGTVSAAAASVAGIAHAPDEIHVCGSGWVKVQADGSIDPADAERAMPPPEARAAVLARLGSEPGELARLAAVLMAAIDRDDRHRAALISPPTPCEGPDCEATQAAETEVAEAREEIARAAVSSSDPKVYALALNACNQRRDGACQLLSARQLARLDPRNASPWLQILDDATARKDAAAQSEALHRIANAERNDFGAFTLTGAVLKAVPDSDDDAAMLAGLTMSIAAVGIEAAWSMPGYQAVNQLCRFDALRDANRAQVCAGVATVLAERSDTMIGRTIGAAIGKRVGWSAERVDQMRGEYNAYAASLGADGIGLRPDLGCPRMRRELDRLRQTARLGEVGAMREWVARSGKRPEDFVLEERARQPQVQRARAESAASAAASAAR